MCILNVWLCVGVEAVTKGIFSFHQGWCLLCFLQLARCGLCHQWLTQVEEHCGVQFVARFSSASGCWAASLLLDFNGLWPPFRAIAGCSPRNQKEEELQ